MSEAECMRAVLCGDAYTTTSCIACHDAYHLHAQCRHASHSTSLRLLSPPVHISRMLDELTFQLSLTKQSTELQALLSSVEALVFMTYRSVGHAVTLATVCLRSHLTLLLRSLRAQVCCLARQPGCSVPVLVLVDT